MSTLNKIDTILNAAIKTYLSVPYEDRQLSALRENVTEILEILTNCVESDYKDLVVESDGSRYQDLVFLVGAVKYLQKTGIDAEVLLSFQHETSPQDAPIVNFKIKFND